MMIIEPEPYATYAKPREYCWVNDLLELNAGSLITCGSDKTAKRWWWSSAEEDCSEEDSLDSLGSSASASATSSSSSVSFGGLQLVGVYEGCFSEVTGVVERYNNKKKGYTIITASLDSTLREWDIDDCSCIGDQTIWDGGVECLVKTKDESRLVCGMSGGIVEIRSLGEVYFDLIDLFNIHTKDVVSICELDDGSTFVSAVARETARWRGGVLMTVEYCRSSQDTRTRSLPFFN